MRRALWYTPGPLRRAGDRARRDRGRRAVLRLAELRERERGRQRRVRGRLRLLSGLAAVYGAALAVAGLYVSLPARLAEQIDRHDFVLQRPALAPFARSAAGAALAGGALGLGLVLMIHGGPQRRYPVPRWLLIGALFGLASPFLTWALLPPVGDVIDLIGGRLAAAAFLPRLAADLVDTLRFSSVNGILSLYVGLAGGALLAAGGALMEAVSDGPGAAPRAPIVVCAALTLGVCLALFFGPFAWFERLVYGIGTRLP